MREMIIFGIIKFMNQDLKIIIREAANNSKDLKEIRGLVSYLMKSEKTDDIDGDTEKIMRDRIMPGFDADIGKTFVAEYAGKIIGVLLIEFRHGLVAAIAYSAIYPEYQRQGIGTMLVEKSAEFAKSKGIKIMSVLIDKDNKNSRAFHEKNGFKLFGYSLRKEI